MDWNTEVSDELASEVINALVRSGATKYQLADIAKNKWGITDELVNRFLPDYRPHSVTVLWELGLSGRVLNVLMHNHIETIEGLCRHSEQQLLWRVRGLGPVGMAEVKEKLSGRGLSLHDD